MKLTPIMKSLALAGIISTLPVTSWAETSPKEAAAATKQANDALYKQRVRLREVTNTLNRKPIVKKPVRPFSAAKVASIVKVLLCSKVS